MRNISFMISQISKSVFCRSLLIKSGNISVMPPGLINIMPRHPHPGRWRRRRLIVGMVLNHGHRFTIITVYDCASNNGCSQTNGSNFPSIIIPVIVMAMAVMAITMPAMIIISFAAISAMSHYARYNFCRYIHHARHDSCSHYDCILCPHAHRCCHSCSHYAQEQN